jgi:flagellar protein FlgJ
MSPTDFFHKYYDLAKQASANTGVSALLIMAQAALESGWGEHAPENNFFGIKADKSWTGAKRAVATHEFIKGVKTPVTAYFRSYSSPEESFEDWANFLKKNPRYSAVLSASDTVSAARELQKAGYSTSPTYADSLIVVAHKIDSSVIPESTYLEPLAEVTGKKAAQVATSPVGIVGILTVMALGIGAYVMTRG